MSARGSLGPRVKLRSVCSIVAGQSPSSSAYNGDGNGLPFYQGKKEFTDRYLAAPSVWTTETTKRALSGDIVMSVRAPVGPVNEVLEDICIGRGLAAIRAGDGIERGFLWYALLWMQPRITGSDGAVFPSISRAQIEELEIPLPPTNEQKLIVAALDQAFAALDRARANIEASISDARALYQSFLAGILEKDGQFWPAVKLGEVYDVRDGTHDSPKYQEFGHALVTSKNLTSEGLDLSKVSYISSGDFIEISRRSAVHRGDLLFAMIGTIGNPTVVEIEPTFAIKNVALFKMRRDRDARFLRHLLSSQQVKEQMEREAKGTTQKFVGLGYLRDFEARIPPREEERRIIELLDEVESKSRKAADALKRNAEDLTALRQSLLQAAFSGQLS